MGTQVTASPTAFNAALFYEYAKGNSFTNLLTESAPQGMTKRNKQAQTSPHAPIVRLTDLTKAHMDTVEVDIYHKLTGIPTMGDKKIEGRGESLTSASMALTINQGRHNVDSGGRMAQKKTKHDLQKLAKTLLADDYYHRLEDEKTLYHVAGARGTKVRADDILPLGNNPVFAEVMVNPVKPPTFDRHFYGGDATSLSSLDSTDIMTLDAVENLRLQLDEQNAMSIPSIKYHSDMIANESPLYVLYVSPRQFKDLKNSAGGKALSDMMSKAMVRSKGFNHPLFFGECYLWENILIKKLKNYVEFEAGTDVSVSNNDSAASVSSAQAQVKTHRSILLGGQALVNAFGNTGSNGNDGHFGMKEVMTDHDNSKEISINWMNGMSKIRFADKNGRINDVGCAVLDTAVSQ